MRKIKILITIALLFVGLTACSNRKQVTVTAHRGASAHAPENTIVAMTKAIELNSYMSELDVQETADGEIILLHDKSLKRTANLDTNIWEINYEDLKSLEVGAWFDEKYRGEAIPKLSEIIDIVKGKMKLNIELKTNGHEKKLAERSLEIVKKMGFENECIFTSFDFDQVDRIKELDPEMTAGYIFSSLPLDFDVFNSNVDLFSVHYKIVDKLFVEKAMEQNKEVHVWTVNDKEEMKRLINLGVNSIITNYPDRLNEVLDELEM